MAVSVGDTAALKEIHQAQLVYPELAGPVALPANGGAWTYGALTQVVPISTITSLFVIHELTVSGMSANASFVIKIMWGASDTVWSYASITRGGVQTQSVLVPVQGRDIPANSIVKAQLADSVGTSTLEVKINYHLHT